MDYIGRVLDVMERNREIAGMRFGRLDPGAAEPRWELLPHSRYDGLGGLATLLRRDGFVPRGHVVPLGRERRPPGALVRASAMQAYLTSCSASPWIWPRLRPAPPDGRPSPNVGWTVFEPGETAALRAAAKRHGVSMNSWLLSHLSRLVEERRRVRAPGLGWILAVNLRGAVALERPTANHAAALPLNLPRNAGARAVHAVVEDAIRRGLHWGAWDMVRACGRLLGERAIEIVYEQGWNLPGKWVGMFSNLGKLRGGGPSGVSWLFAPPVCRGLPFGAGCVTWNGRLSLVVQFDFRIPAEIEPAQAWIRAWRNRLLADARQPPRALPSTA